VDGARCAGPWGPADVGFGFFHGGRHGAPVPARVADGFPAVVLGGGRTVPGKEV
jgi:hypothetical protein